MFLRTNKPSVLIYYPKTTDRGDVAEEKQPFDDDYAKSHPGNCPDWRNNLFQVA